LDSGSDGSDDDDGDECGELKSKAQEAFMILRKQLLSCPAHGKEGKLCKLNKSMSFSSHIG
jgi:hypothetical protein